jgi:hypothetical protein
MEETKNCQAGLTEQFLGRKKEIEPLPLGMENELFGGQSGKG